MRRRGSVLAAGLLPLALALAACASGGGRAPAAAPVASAAPAPAPAPVLTRVVVRQVKTACVPKDLPRAPRYPDSDRALKKAGGAADRYQLMAAGRLLRDRRLELLERVVSGCR